MNLARRTRILVATAAALAAPSAAHAYNCTAPGSDMSGCLPPMLQSVEANSFSFIFKVADSSVHQNVVVSLYNAAHSATNSPASCIALDNTTTCTYGESGAHTCYQKVNSSMFGVSIQPGQQYSYNVNVGGTCTQSAGSYSISGGSWFNARRNVTTAPPPGQPPSTISFAVIGDTRDGSQDDCKDGVAKFPYGDIVNNCGGSDAQRSAFATEVTTKTTDLDFIIHTGDIASSDHLKETFAYWRDIGSVWQDISTTFAYGNHEFASVPNGGSEVFGTHTETFDYDMIAAPANPTNYPPSTGSTYYAQNWGDVHIVYLNSQSCVLEAYTAGIACPGNPPDMGTLHYADGATDQFTCGCYGYSAAQRTWLIKDLKYANSDPNIDFIVVVDHKPFWSNGSDEYQLSDDGHSSTHIGSKAAGAWTNTLAREEYALNDGNEYNLSPLGGYTFASDGSGWIDANMQTLDSILQMYNVDLYVTSHAHYYERLTDTRYRVAGDGLPHLIIGGGGSPEQAYQCPQATNCHRGFPLGPPSYVNHLPKGVNFNYGTDGNFYFGHGIVNTSLHTLLMYGVMIDDEHSVETQLESFWVASRKTQIRPGGAHSAATDPFNGCNLVYDSNSLLGFDNSNGDPTQTPRTSHNVNCVVN